MLSAYGTRFGLDHITALKVAGAFGAGMGRMGETCGAVTGAFMVVGLKHGKARAGDDEAREKTYGLVHEFSKRFRKRNRSILCKDLLGYDLGSPEGRAAVEQKKLFVTLCPRFVQDSVEILEEIL